MQHQIVGQSTISRNRQSPVCFRAKAEHSIAARHAGVIQHIRHALALQTQCLAIEMDFVLIVCEIADHVAASAKLELIGAFAAKQLIIAIAAVQTVIAFAP